MILSAIRNQGHEGFQKTLQRLGSDFYWKGIKLTVQDYIHACSTCQLHKSGNLQPSGMLQPLPVLVQI